MQNKPGWPTLADVQAAAIRLRGVAHETPLMASRTYSDMAGYDVWLKLENMQKTGSFKIRGAFNMVSQLSPEEKARGVIAASAGNHAQGVAYAARAEGVACTIVMPEGASLAKVSATQSYGARVVLHGDGYDDAFQLARELQATQGYTYVHAFDHAGVIAGQGTVGLEILRQLPDVESIVVPMGGGGLAAGIALAVKSIRPQVKVFGVEASAAACFRTSLDEGHVVSIASAGTVADGIAVRRPGDLTFELVQALVDDVITVDEEEIVRALVLLMERGKIVAEGAAAAACAAVFQRKLENAPGRAVVVVSGGNVDLTLLSRIIEHGLAKAGRHLRLTVTLVDKPGALRNFLQIVADSGANVGSISHHRIGQRISLGETEVDIDMETRDEDHIVTLLRTIEAQGYVAVRKD